MDQKNYRDQLLQLKAMTVRFGVLHEAQIIQLRNYPLLIPHVIKAKTAVEIENKKIIFKCISDGKFRKTKKVKDFLLNIKYWTQTIVWDDSIIEIYVDDKLIYNSLMEIIG